MKKKNLLVAGTLLLILALASSAYAGAAGAMPWDAPLTSVLNALTGTTIRTIAAIAIVITGLAIAFGESGGMFTRAAQIVFGISIALLAVSFVTQLFGAGGGLAF